VDHGRIGLERRPASHAARHPEVLQRASNGEEFTIFDFASDGD